MINPRAFQNYLADCVAKHLSPELQPAARKAIEDKQLTPLVLEAVAKQIEESAKAGASGNTQNIAELTAAVREVEKRLVENATGEKTSDKIPAAIAEIGAQVNDARNSLRTLEDKVDTLVPYQLWKVAVFAGLAFIIGAVVSWNIRPVYKQWQYDQQQEGR